MIGLTAVDVERIIDRVADKAAVAKDQLERMRSEVTDSREFADAIDAALRAVGYAESVAETVLERRVHET